MTHWTYRRAGRADAGTVRDITRAAYAKWVPVIGREPKPMMADYEQAVANHVIDLLEDGSRPVALIEVIPEPAHLLIENIAVLPEWHGRGLGGQLVDRAETIARSLGLSELRLYTNAKFATNIAFYAKRGFEEFLRETVAPDTVAVHMRKVIGP